jgi:tetratricopeptide (TPR) repeat protein
MDSQDESLMGFVQQSLMDKNHPMNGYVDVVAFTWGSSDRSNKDRLRKSQLLGHCFVQANEHSLHHLYLALTRGGSLAPTDWYALCAAATDEHESSFLRRELERLGNAMARFPKQWELYLAEVQMRLASKQYSLAELGSAIAWLQQYANHAQIIPGTLRLQLDSSNLALANHRGQIQDEVVFRCLDWVRKLEDEAPQMVAEAILRLASTMTNNFQFDALEDTVETWLAKPVAVAGLLNYGKLQSTRGQMHAFLGDPTSAVTCFEAAAASFSRLSDPIRVARETHQTKIYEIIARMDAMFSDADGGGARAEVESLLEALRQLLGNRESEAISRRLSASDASKRFEHHCKPTGRAVFLV